MNTCAALRRALAPPGPNPEHSHHYPAWGGRPRDLELWGDEFGGYITDIFVVRREGGHYKRSHSI